LAQVGRENNMKPKEMDPQAIEMLSSYEYPGNIRELRNLIERLLIISREDKITEGDVRRVLPAAPAAQNDSLLYSKLEDTERALLLKTLEENRWHISRVAKILGLERSHLYKKMKKYGISRPD